MQQRILDLHMQRSDNKRLAEMYAYAEPTRCKQGRVISRYHSVQRSSLRVNKHMCADCTGPCQPGTFCQMC